MAGTKRVAVLIDCENIRWQLGEAVVADATRHGRLSVRRGYGDWGAPHLTGWRAALPALGVQPVQHTAHVTGKGSADAALIVDAMDLLHSGDVDTFVLVSSDSDFTRLAVRLRESGRLVYGIGELKTHTAFRSACDGFTFTENLARSAAGDGAVAPKVAAPPLRIVAQRPAPSPQVARRLDPTAVADVEKVLLPAIRAAKRDDGWALLSAVGVLVAEHGFDRRRYGFGSLRRLLDELPSVEVKEVTGPGGSKQLCARPARVATRA